MPLPDLPSRVCSCGCGKVYIPKRSDQKYATQTCKMRAYRKRKNPFWFDLLTPGERDQWSYLRQSANPDMARSALWIEVEGRANGLQGARKALTQALWIFGIQEGDWLNDGLWALYPEGLVDEIMAGYTFGVQTHTQV